jgi:5-methyltetrahydrofolate--homocysteine methyltransferase
VHDIGKNLVEIILSNNGFDVENLGIKQPIEDILAAHRARPADAIGLSGLLVKSTVAMKEYLAQMRQLGHGVPVILGGAALTKDYVETVCREAYQRDDDF